MAEQTAMNCRNLLMGGKERTSVKAVMYILWVSAACNFMIVIA